MLLMDLKRSTAYNVDSFAAIYYREKCIYIGNNYGKRIVAEYDDEKTCAKAFYKIVTQMSTKGVMLVFAPMQIEVEQW